MKEFIKGRIRSIKYALNGFFLLIRTEDAVKTHIISALILTSTSLYLNISTSEWLFQIICFTILFVAEGINTAIEKICDFIHPDFHKLVGEIKDISAGAVTFAFIFGTIVILIIYIPYILNIFRGV